MPSKQQKRDLTKWEVRKVKLSEVTPFEDNPRSIKERHQNGLRASLMRFGYVDLIVWNERTGHIVGGHQRYQLLVEEGVEEANMVVVDLSPEEEVAANLTLNNPEIEGEWDDPINELLDSIADNDPEFFAEANFDDLRSAVEKMVPKEGQESYEENNSEIDIEELMADCDTKCPCCDFEWEVDDKDVSVLTPAQREEMIDG